MGNNENDLSDNIYDRNNLIEFLFKIIDSWFTGIWQSADYYLDTHSIHDLFSKDSWLMERMEWDTNCEKYITKLWIYTRLRMKSLNRCKTILWRWWALIPLL